MNHRAEYVPLWAKKIFGMTLDLLYPNTMALPPPEDGQGSMQRLEPLKKQWSTGSMTAFKNNFFSFGCLAGTFSAIIRFVLLPTGPRGGFGRDSRG